MSPVLVQAGAQAGQESWVWASRKQTSPRHNCLIPSSERSAAQPHVIPRCHALQEVLNGTSPTGMALPADSRLRRGVSTADDVFCLFHNRPDSSQQGSEPGSCEADLRKIASVPILHRMPLHLLGLRLSWLWRMTPSFPEVLRQQCNQTCTIATEFAILTVIVHAGLTLAQRTIYTDRDGGSSCSHH